MVVINLPTYEIDEKKITSSKERHKKWDNQQKFANFWRINANHAALVLIFKR